MEDSLELFLEEDGDFPLGGSILISSIFRLEYVCARVVLEETFDEVENILFANSLMGATIQDGGKRERSIFDTLHYTTMVWLYTLYYKLSI